MPGYDRTGPQGRGTMSGRGMGRCGGSGRGNRPGRGYGLNRGYRSDFDDPNFRSSDIRESFTVSDVENIVGDISDMVNRLGKFLSRYKEKDNSGD